MTELQEKWVLALESGKYAQCKDRLRKEVGFCCLGVACDVKDASGWTTMNGWYSYGGSHYALNRELRELFDLTSKQQDELMGMNDEGATFAQIAARLREMFR